MNSNQERIKEILDILTDDGINPSSEIESLLCDVAMECQGPFSADIYYKSDLEEFEKDVILNRNIQIDLDTGTSEGTFTNIFTYCNEVSYAINEEMYLTENGIIKDTILENVLQYGEKSKLIDPDDYAIILIETISWKKEMNSEKEYKNDLHLYIYCPEDVKIESEGING